MKPDKIDEAQRLRTQSKLSIQEIQMKIEHIEIILAKESIDYHHISAGELIEYFKGPAPSGDLTTLSDILENRWLLIHELVELSELKKLKLEIFSSLLRTHPAEVDYAHIIALEYELKFANQGGDNEWVIRRIRGIKSWLADDEKMPSEIKSRCHKLIEKYPH